MKWMQNMLERLQRRAETKGASRTLFILAFMESSFFPIPPDLLLIPLALGARKRAFRLGAVCLVGSVLGGAFGYFLGYFFMDTVGMSIVNFYGMEEGYRSIQEWYHEYDAWAVAAAGLTPIPYKVATLTAGAFKLDFLTFMAASVISRGIRFMAEAAMIYLFGEKIRYFLEKRFDLLLLLALVAVVGGFVIVKYLL